LFTGCNGISFENAVIIKSKTTSEEISNEYVYLSMFYGNRGKVRELQQQSPADHYKKSYDVMKINLSNGETKEVIFDITNFFG